MTILTNRILNADCLKALPMLPDASVDLTPTDPPYITNYRSRDGRRMLNDDNDKWLKPAFAEMHRVLAHDRYCVSFYGWPTADRFMQAYRAAGFRVVGSSHVPQILRVEHALSALHARMRASSGERQSTPAGEAHRRCHPLEIHGQQTAPHAETAVGAPAPD